MRALLEWRSSVLRVAAMSKPPGTGGNLQLILVGLKNVVFQSALYFVVRGSRKVHVHELVRLVASYLI
jgi:hypothetical protein